MEAFNWPIMKVDMKASLPFEIIYEGDIMNLLELSHWSERKRKENEVC